VSGGKKARDFGIRFEHELSHWFDRPTTRSTRPGVHDDGGDIVIDGVVLEAKARHHGSDGSAPRWLVYSWFAEAERKCRDSELPALALKRPGVNVGGALLVVRLRDLGEVARRLA
jgi:hypothetical protein